MIAIAEFSDALNPVLVKELRQGMKSRSFAAAFLAMQALMVLCVGFQVVMRAQPDIAQALTAAFWACAGLPLVVFLPLVAIGAIHSEHRQETLSLVLLTRLTPWRLVTGKWSSLMAQAALIATAALPYTVIRYFLGGIDTVRDLLALAMLLGGSGLLCACGLLISTFKRPWTLFVRGLILLIVLSPLTVGLFLPVVLVFYAMSARPDLIPLQLLLAALIVLHGAAARFTDFLTGQRVLPRIAVLITGMLAIGCIQIAAKLPACHVGHVLLLPALAWFATRAAALAWPRWPDRSRHAVCAGAVVLLFLAMLLPGPIPGPGRLFFLSTLVAAICGPLYLLLLTRRWLGVAMPAHFVMAQVILLPLSAALVAGYLHKGGGLPPILHIAPSASLLLVALDDADPAYLWPNVGFAGLCVLGLAHRAMRAGGEAVARAPV